MASTVWKGFISFGLITIPVRLFAAARTERVSFNQIHHVCGGRIKQQTYLPAMRSRRRTQRTRQRLRSGERSLRHRQR